ncbi:MAG: SdiA-regulated domain-containing protein, partial [Psychroserpens sp.]|nr:SdiA-regulated domain-containing protein [Psychroserpens sp.]
MKTCLKLILTGLIFISCTTGKLKLLAGVSSSLDEVSAIEKTTNSDVLWVIQDAGNKNHLYGLNLEGQIIRDIEITNADNRDWEDLTSDNEGNIYIGDFGNNNEKQKDFTIYKVTRPEKNTRSTEAEGIHFKLPDDMDSVDFEAFFLYKGFFYVFSKDHKTCELIKIPNSPGNHIASYVAKIELKDKHTKVTSADISD